MKRLIQFLLITLIKIYRVTLSRLLPPSCRFTPSCSEYALEAIKVHGPYKGFILAFVRILKCNPFFESRTDKVPRGNK